MGIRKFIKKQFNVGDWLGKQHLKDSMRTVKDIYKDTLKQKNQEDFKSNTFDEYIDHYQITPEEIEKTKKTSRLLVYVYGGFSFGLFLYMFHQFFSGHLLGGIMCLVLSLLFLAYGLKEQLRYVQFKEKKLKITVKEFFKALK